VTGNRIAAAEDRITVKRMVLVPLERERVQIAGACNCDPKQLVGHIIGDKKPMDKRGVFREALCKCTAHQKITGIGD